jgi:hypothetical protein
MAMPRIVIWIEQADAFCDDAVPIASYRTPRHVETILESDEPLHRRDEQSILILPSSHGRGTNVASTTSLTTVNGIRYRSAISCQ